MDTSLEEGVPREFLVPLLEAQKPLDLVWLKAPPRYSHGPNKNAFVRRPIVIVHGVFATKHSLDDLIANLRKDQPASDIAFLDVLESGWSVFTPMWKQIEEFYKHLKPVLKSKQAKQFGINIIGKCRPDGLGV